MTDITVVLDRSGSMQSVQEATIKGFNDFIRDQKAGSDKAQITLVQFDDQYEPNYEGIPIGDAKPLDVTTFVPRGGTALLDAIGRTIANTKARIGKQKLTEIQLDPNAEAVQIDKDGNIVKREEVDKVIFAIITDGYENSSKEFTKDAVFKTIKEQTDTEKWAFTYLGANQDAIQVGETLGVMASNSLSYGHTTVGTQNAFAAFNANTRQYRSKSVADGVYGYTSEERTKAMDSNPNPIKSLDICLGTYDDHTSGSSESCNRDSHKTRCHGTSRTNDYALSEFPPSLSVVHWLLLGGFLLASIWFWWLLLSK